MAYQYERFERANDYNKAHYDEKKTHTEMCLDYLKRNGSITPLEALTAFNSFRLAAQICKLRKDGYVIKTELNDTEPRFAIYTLMQEGEEYDG